MANRIRIKRSSEPSKRPSHDQLQSGEIALNTYDGRLFSVRDEQAVLGIGSTVTLLTPWTENIGGGIYYTDSSVGIGTTVPSSTLDIVGDVDIDGDIELVNLSVSGVSTFSSAVGFGTTATFSDGASIYFGDSNDLQIYHDGTRSYIVDDGTGQLSIRGSYVSIGSTTGANRATFSSTGTDLYYEGNFKFGTRDFGARVVGSLALYRQTSDPDTFNNYAHIYSKDVASKAEVFVRDENGNVTQISPHNTEGDWVYYSQNVKTGKRVRINMEKMIKKLEEITGETFFEEYVPGAAI